MASSKKKPPVKFDFQKRYAEIVKDLRPGGGYVEIGTTPFGYNEFHKMYAGDWKEVETKDPIKDWVERWLENELGKV